MRSELEEKIFKFMLLLLKARQHWLVYQISSFGGSHYGLSRWMRPFYEASADIQQELTKHGYSMCPYCQWAIAKGKTHAYCNEQLQ